MSYFFTRLLILLALALLLTSTAFSQRPELVVDTAQSDSLRAFAFSPDGKVFATATRDNAIRLWDVASGKNIATLEGHTGIVRTVAFSGSLVASGSSDQTVRLWELRTGRVLLETRGHKAPITQVAFSPGGQYFVSASLDDTVKVWDAATGRVLRSLTGEKQGVTTVTVSPDGKIIAKGGRNSLIKIFDIASGREVRTLRGHEADMTAVAFSPDGKLLASASLDETIKIWPTDFSSEPLTISTSAGHVISLAFSPDGRGIISGAFETASAPVGRVEGAPVVFSLTSIRGNDVAITPRAASTTRELCKVYSFRDSSWAVIDTEGRYDASFGGDIPWLKWKIGEKLAALDQLKSAFYQPGLLAMLLGFSQEPLPPIIKLTEVKPYPDLIFDAPAAGSTRLTIKLANSGGGIGRVQVKLNNTEIYEDARGSGFNPAQSQATLNVDIAGPALMPGKPNKIQVVAWNAEGYLSSPTETAVVWTPLDLRGDAPFLNDGQPDNSPQEFHAIVIGISEYSDSSIRLKYAARDAEAMAKALEIGAKRLFPGPGRVEGQGRVHIRLLKTSDDPQTAPTKNNITKAFEEARRSKPQDLLVIYMSGHGVALRGGGDPSRQNELYCYLTKEARSKNPEAFNLPEVVRSATVTSEEIARWIQEIPAQRRVLILDTCAAGAAVRDLSLKGEDYSFYQIKALDKLKDRMGFFVLMGSAANSVSWEASAYGQGLLTYALLTKMKSTEPNKDETEVDVSSLFQYAADSVPQLALGLGGVQQPEIIVPQGSASFPIGLLNLNDKKNIPLQMKKPVVLSPVLLDREDGTDEELQLTRALSKKLDEETYTRAKGSIFQSEIVYVEANSLQGAYVPTGTYVIQGQAVKVDLVLSRDGKRIRFSVTGSRDRIQELVTEIVDKILEEVVKT